MLKQLLVEIKDMGHSSHFKCLMCAYYTITFSVLDQSIACSSVID